MIHMTTTTTEVTTMSTTNIPTIAEQIAGRRVGLDGDIVANMSAVAGHTGRLVEVRNGNLVVEDSITGDERFYALSTRKLIEWA